LRGKPLLRWAQSQQLQELQRGRKLGSSSHLNKTTVFRLDLCQYIYGLISFVITEPRYSNVRARLTRLPASQHPFTRSQAAPARALHCVVDDMLHTTISLPARGLSGPAYRFWQLPIRHHTSVVTLQYLVDTFSDVLFNVRRRVHRLPCSITSSVPLSNYDDEPTFLENPNVSSPLPPSSFRDALTAYSQSNRGEVNKELIRIATLSQIIGKWSNYLQDTYLHERSSRIYAR